MKRIIGCLVAIICCISGCLWYLFADPKTQACDKWAAKIVSAQGTVKVQKKGEPEWNDVEAEMLFCFGDSVWVKERSRATVVIRNESAHSRPVQRHLKNREQPPLELSDKSSFLRLNENTIITFDQNSESANPDQKTEHSQNSPDTTSDKKKERSFLLRLITGDIHFFSNIFQKFKVETDYVVAAVEGTEFLIEAEPEQSVLSVFKGKVKVKVKAPNESDDLSLISGKSAIIGKPIIGKEGTEKSPIVRPIVRPVDAVQWALYYPPIIDWRPEDFQGGTEWQIKVQKSIGFYWKGDLAKAFSNLAEAFSNLEEISDEPSDETIEASCFLLNYRAALLLSVGRVDEADKDIKACESESSYAPALESVIAVVKNEKEKALEDAKDTVEEHPYSSVAYIALSYAQQANFDISGALESTQKAVKLNSDNALAHARLAELWLCVGELDKSALAASDAVGLNPNLARTQTIQGFANLTRIKTEDSKAAFDKAIALDQADPLPRLGMGLAMIRKGQLSEGRSQIEIAASLDPNNSLIRSYLGKAYFEEKRDKVAEEQFKVAKELDPNDPTPWLYSAIQKQTQNRPVEALQDLQKSVELNDNRAVYRSKLLLDEDLAARSVSLARIYHDLGFEQLALIEGWKSLNTDPSNYSAHRLLADSYAALPRHEIARVSELLQAQLLQPVNINPVQPHLAEANLSILSGAGPGGASFNEFSPLFNRNRTMFQASGMFGENSTFGDEIVLAGVEDRFSYSIGQFHYETDGFRENNDQSIDIYNFFAQMSLSHRMNVQAEYRYKNFKRGDLPIRFYYYDDILRQKTETHSMRLGFHHAFTSNSDLIASIVYNTIKEDSGWIITDADGYMAEFQNIFRTEQVSFISGLGYSQQKEKTTGYFSENNKIYHTNIYMYSQINYPEDVTWTLGGSSDFFKGATLECNQFNPKFGVTWKLSDKTTLRASAFRNLQRALLSNQTIEPTQISGFNQFFEDVEGTKSWRYGIGIDQRFSKTMYGGMELTKRDLEKTKITVENSDSDVDQGKGKENIERAYLYWAFHPFLTGSMEFQHEHLKIDRNISDDENYTSSKIYRLPLSLNFSHPSGLSSQLKATYVSQKGTFQKDDNFVSGRDNFWLLDAFVRYRLPEQMGFITIEGRNLLNEDFNFQDTDPANPSIYPECLIYAKYTLMF